MNPITVSVLQDQYTAQPEPIDETLPFPALRRAGETFKQACLAPQMALARQAVAQGTSLVVFREDCNGAANLSLHRYDRPDLLAALAEPVPGGPTGECLSELARAGGCYVLGCYMEKHQDRFFNTAVLYAPTGEFAAKYRKTHLPPLERLLVTPGDELPVFDTEIGRLGMQICYDMMTPEVMRCLALQGADLVCWPSLGYGWWDEAGDFTIRSRAHDNQVYLLGALPWHSCIVDPYGDVLAAGGLEPLSVLTARITPGADPLQDPLHHNTYMTQTPSLRERHLFERRPELYGPIVDPAPQLQQRYPHTKMHEIDNDKQKAFNRYRSAADRLHWQTRPDRSTH